MFKKILSVFLCLTLLSGVSCNIRQEETGPYPIIIIPGFIGSELVNASGRTVWPADFSGNSAEAFADFLSLSLDTDAADKTGLTPVRYSPMTEYKSGDSIGSYNAYGELAVALSEEYGYENVYFFGYDWRLSNLHTAEELEKYIDTVIEETDADKVNIVAHSMGGLVTSAYLSRTGGRDRINIAVTCGTPFIGLQKAYTTLESGNGFIDFSDPAYASVVPAIKDMFNTMPSLYELMPSHGWESLGLTQGDALKAEATVAQRQGYEFYGAITEKMTELWQNTSHINIVGRGYTTPGENGDVEGDGIVACYSATLSNVFTSGNHKLMEFNLGHNALVSDKAAIDAILAVFA